MKAIEIMNEEHKYILRMLQVIRKCCFKILNNEEIIYEDFYKIIDFIRNYADNHHHKKEEKILFIKMVEELGEPAKKAVNQGMLVEHDLGRLHVRKSKSWRGRGKARCYSKCNFIYTFINTSHR